MRLASSRVLVVVLGTIPSVAVLASAQGASVREHRIDIGSAEDEQFIVEGIHQAEGPNPKSKHPFYRQHSMRWFGNKWVLRLPVFARQDNEVTMRASFSRGVRLVIGNNWELTIPSQKQGTGQDDYERQFVIPKDIVGEQELLELRGTCEPPYTKSPNAREKRELALAVDAFRVRPIKVIPSDALVARQVRPPAAKGAQHFINLGLPGDDRWVGQGIYHREGPSAHAKDLLARYVSFRWFSDNWVLTIPVFPHRHNEVVIRGRSRQPLRVTGASGFSAMLLTASGPGYENRFVIPAEHIGAAETFELHGSTITSLEVKAGQSDRRRLVMLTDWVCVRPVDELPADQIAVQSMPTGKEPSLPLSARLRGTEMRPLYTEIAPYVFQARLMRCNVMTIGPMNGQHFTAFPTKYGTVYPKMQPDFIPSQVEALHEQGIAAIGWLPFNVQDLRRPDQCQAANKHPEWRMQYVDDQGHSTENRVGMCVVSSPWRQMHAKILQEAAATGIDGVFFDGFYLGGIPHPIAPGCVCRWCRESFQRETGLTAPAKIDWTDASFRRWVRWRNEKLIEVARFFRDQMRQANPSLLVACNWNMWPFGSKDWETAIPLWAMDDLGVSQHAYSGRLDMEWIMLGYKSRLSHDLNPKHSDIWRTSRPVFKYTGTEADRARHELAMRTFMLSGLAHGTTPWHGGHISPPEIGIRIHEAVRARERFFSHDELRHVGVVLSQNTHDFYGHLPKTSNRADYRDTILGTWLLLTEHHVPFRFVFDNQLTAQELATYKVVVLPNTVCLSDAMAKALRQFVAGGGRLITTGDSGACDEWANRRQENTLSGVAAVRLSGTPALQWLRERDEKAAARLLGPIQGVSAPLIVKAPRSVVANACWAPDRKAVWLHLLNVSAFYPGGDTGFRGIDREPVFASGAEHNPSRRQHRPVTGITVRTPGLNVSSVRLGVAGTPLESQAGRGYVLPSLDIHDVVVLEIK